MWHTTSSVVTSLYLIHVREYCYLIHYNRSAAKRFCPRERQFSAICKKKKNIYIYIIQITIQGIDLTETTKYINELDTYNKKY